MEADEREKVSEMCALCNLCKLDGAANALKHHRHSHFNQIHASSVPNTSGFRSNANPAQVLLLFTSN